MKMLSFCVILLAATSAEAFSPFGTVTPALATKPGRRSPWVSRGSESQRQDRFPLLNDVLVEPKDGSGTSEVYSSQSSSSSTSELYSSKNSGLLVVAEEETTKELDDAQKIFFSSMDFAKPLEESLSFSLELEESSTSTAEDLVTDNDNVSFVLSAVSDAANAALESDMMEETIPPVGYENVESSGEPSNDDEHAGVTAVLEASREAAEAAEATMPRDLHEQFGFPSPNSSGADVEVPGSTSDEPLILDELPKILPASAVVGEPVTAPKIEAPGVSKILKFAIPAIGVWLCGPLLSLIDTSAVGVLSGTIQQAALNPAVAVTDYAALLIAFMYTGTTNLVAAAQESDRSVEGKPATTKTMIGAMQLSTYVGAGLGAFLFVFARPLLKAIIGNGNISPAVFAAAMKYVRIRALGMPAAAIIGSTQAACLGVQDIRSPLYVLVAAALVNFIGDTIFVGSKHAMIGGAAGAAWATVFSQYAAVAIFVRWLCNRPETSSKPRVMNLSKQIMEITGKPASKGEDRRQGFSKALASFGERKAKNDNPSKLTSFVKQLSKRLSMQKQTSQKKADTSGPDVTVRGFLKGKFGYSDLFKFPSKEIRDEFSPYLAPVTTTQVGRVSGYIAMSHVVASSLGTVSMAAQQVIVSLFYCLCPIADSLSLTAQSFLPSISEKAASPEKAAAMKKTLVNFFKAGGVFGAAMMTAVCMIPLLSGFFTADPQVISLVNSVTPLLLAFFGVHGVLCSAEGLLLGQKDLNYLGKMYAAYFVAVPYFMLRVKRAALTGSHVVNLISVWKVFVGYQMFRAVAWIVRSAQLQRRTDMEASRAQSDELAQQQLLSNMVAEVTP